LITAFWVFPGGGWPNWAPLVIYPGNNLFLNDDPTWWSIPSSYGGGLPKTNTVVESIKFFNFKARCRKNYIETVSVVGMNFLPNQNYKNTVYVTRSPVVSINTVIINGNLVPWTALPGSNWILLQNQVSIGTQVVVNYTYSPSVDMMNTNWNCDRGSFLFYNNIPCPP